MTAGSEGVVAVTPAALLAHLQRMPMTEWVWSDAEMIFATLAALADQRDERGGDSQCARCGKLWPSAPADYVHKCECGGRVSPVSGDERGGQFAYPDGVPGTPEYEPGGHRILPADERGGDALREAAWRWRTGAALTVKGLGIEPADLVAAADAMDRLAALASPAPGCRVGDGVEQDAARWRALMASDRIRMMGAAGFDTADDGTISLRDWDGWHHMGLEVWDKHPAKGDASDQHGRKVLLAYVDALAARPPQTGEGK